MSQLPHDLTASLEPWIGKARWYSSKGSEGGRLILHDAVATPNGWLALVDRLDASEIPTARYVVPIEEANAHFIEAASTPAFAGWLIAIVLGERSVEGARGRFRGRGLDRGREVAIGEGRTVDVEPIGGDASNTSLVIRDQADTNRSWVCKLVRACRPGIHPEVELGLVLASVDWKGSPRLVGWLEYVPGPGDGEPAVLAVIHEHVSGCRSAWEELLSRAVHDWHACLAMADELGRTTAAMHAALATAEGPACRPEPWTPAAARDASDRMVAHAAAVFDRLADRRQAFEEPVASRIDRLIADRRPLLERLSVFPDAALPTLRIRVHGDYHLGQVLMKREQDRDRCFVIDFEGEPARSLAERREKTSAAKDVAGMCRSFDYLLRVLDKNGTRRYDAHDLHDIESRFLTAYRATARGRGWWPDDPASADLLLAVYRLDKAIYELAYETDNRPDWVDVPLAALEGY